jgi:hypothetical protein
MLQAEAEALPSLGLEVTATRSLVSQWQSPSASPSQRTASVYAPATVMNWDLTEVWSPVLR